MAKRNKAKFASKGRKSALRVEALEQRQLLAVVTGGGTEVGPNVQHPNGNVYDQVLMTGSSVTVTADAGQVTRVSFLDLNGDIVQAEFSGKGTLTVSMDSNGFASNQPASGYNQPGVNYVKGLASFTIQGEDASTNFSVFSVGSGNAINQGLFDSTHTGGSHFADVARLTIVSDPSNPGGFSNMGSILAGNAIFADSTGIVGIAAANVNVQGPVVRIGDIDASNTGVPTLNFGGSSQFGTLQVAGGDLVNTNGVKVNNGGFTAVNFTSGGDSAGNAVTAKVVATGTAFANPGTVTVNQTIDTTTSLSLVGKTQTDLNSIFNGRTFTSNLTIDGLASGFTISAAQFNNLTFTGNVAGTVLANQIGSLTATNVSGLISTDLDQSHAANNSEGGIGNVMISGNMSGLIEAATTLGNITVNGNVTGGGTAGLNGMTGAFLASGNVASLNIAGDVNLGATTNDLIGIKKGVFGNVTISGGGSLGNFGTGVNNLGKIELQDLLDGINLGTYTATETTADVNFGGITTDSDGVNVGTATLGTVSISVSGGNTSNGNVADLTLSGVIGDATATSGNTTTALGTVSLTSAAGNVTVSGVLAGGSNANGGLTVSAGKDVSITTSVTGKDVGAYSLTAGTAANVTGGITIGDGVGVVATGNIASVSLTANGAIGLTHSTGANFVGLNIGNVTIGGSAKTSTVTFTSNTDGDVSFLATGSGVNTIGDVTINDSVVGTGGGLYQFQASSIGNVTISAVTPAAGTESAVTSFGVLASGVHSQNLGTTVAAFAVDGNDTINANGSNLATYKIGDVTVTQSYSNSSPSTPDSLFKGDNYFVAAGKIGTLTATGTAANSNDALLFSVNTDSLVLSVGDVDGLLTGAAGTNDVTFTGGSTSIGNINITAGGSSTTVTGVGGTDSTTSGFSGLSVLAGVRVGANTAVVDSATATLAASDLPTAIPGITGTVGNVLIKSYQRTLAVNQGVPVGLSSFTATAGNFYGGIVAKTSVGSLQGTAVAVNTLSSGVLIGPSASNLLTNGDLLVYVL